jgi:hypothetical protein
VARLGLVVIVGTEIVLTAARVAHQHPFHEGTVEQSPQCLARLPFVAGDLADRTQQFRGEQVGQRRTIGLRNVGPTLRRRRQMTEIVARNLVGPIRRKAKIGDGRTTLNRIQIG